MRTNSTTKNILLCGLAAATLSATLSQAHAAKVIGPGDGFDPTPGPILPPHPLPPHPLPPAQPPATVVDWQPTYLTAPDPSCPKRFEKVKDWDRSTAPYSAGGFDWGIGTGTKLSMITNCNKTELALEANIRTTLFTSFEAKALSAVLSASTDKDLHNSVDLSFYVFGFKIDEVNIADSDGAITGSYPVNDMYPSGASKGDWADSYSKAGLTLEYKVTYELVGHFYGSLAYSVSKSGLSLTANADALAYGKATAAGAIYAGGHSLVASGVSEWTMYDGSLSAEASFVEVYIPPVLHPGFTSGGAQASAVIKFPHEGLPFYKNGWKITAALTQNLTEVLKGKAEVKLSLDDDTFVYKKKLFSLPGLNDNDKGEKTWGYTSTIYKTH